MFKKLFSLADEELKVNQSVFGKLKTPRRHIWRYSHAIFWKHWMGKTFFLEAFDEFEARNQVESRFPRYVEHFVQFQVFLKSVFKVTHDIMTRMILSLASCQFIQSMHSVGWVLGWQGGWLRSGRTVWHCLKRLKICMNIFDKNDRNACLKKCSRSTTFAPLEI